MPPEDASRPCLNCGGETPGAYCPHCGQSVATPILSMRGMAREFSEEYLGYDNKLLRSLRALFFSPGLLTKEYLAGHRQRYVRPLRLYLATSVVFFLLFSLRTTSVVRFSFNVPSGDTTARISGNASGAAGQRGLRDTVAALRDTSRPSWLERRLMERYGDVSTDEAVRSIQAGFGEHLPKAMFLLLPMFAALLALLYRRPRRLYAEHFIFALHLHAFAFGMLALTIIGGRWVDLVGKLVLLVYVYLALRRVYMQSRARTALKFALLAILYVPFLVAAMVGVMFATVLL